MKLDRKSHLLRRPVGLAAVLVLGMTLVMLGVSGSRPAGAANPVTIDWSDISPDIPGTPDFVENDNLVAPVDTYFSNAPDPHKDPFHGLGSATGGVNNFNSQLFTNVAHSGVDVIIYYSRNNYDGDILQGPDLYQPVANPNPDVRVTGEWALRVNRDPILNRTPSTVVLSFSQPVFMDEFIVGSLSNVAGSFEHAIVRGFTSADATGPVVKASQFINISNLQDCGPLLFNLCVATGPIPVNNLNNIGVDPDLIDSDADGVYENVGSAADDGVYHVHGIIAQPDGYGRAKLVYSATIRSIAVSYFPTSSASPDPFTDTDYTTQWISAILAPYTFTPEGPTAISLRQVSTSAPDTGLFLIGLVLVVAVLATGLIIGRQQRSKGSSNS